GVALPPRPHKDGEKVTAIILLARHNITGGKNWIYDNDFEPLFGVTLSDVLDMAAVNDAKVHHHVQPVHVLPGEAEGWRTVLLIDFSPLARQIVKPVVTAAKRPSTNGLL